MHRSADDLRQRFLDIARDVLLAVAAGDLSPQSPVVRAAGQAIASLGTVGGPSRDSSASGASPDPVGEPAADARHDARVMPTAGTLERPATRRAVDLAPSEGPVTLTLGARGRGVAPLDHVLAVAALMRGRGLGFPQACAERAAMSDASAQAVRNACCRWLEVGAGDWHPLSFAGARAPAEALARRVIAREPWVAERVADAFGVAEEALRG